jgi:hypothetical protein
MSFLDRMKPGVPRRALPFVAAGAWLIAGMILLYRGELTLHGDPLFTAVGVAAGLVFFRFVFLRISTKHITRMRAVEHERPCMFSFLDWRGYALMTIMISGGILLRTSGLLPPPVIGTFFLCMATPLLLSSIRFAAAGFSFE